MRITFACVLLSSFLLIGTKAAEVDAEVITLAPEAHVEGIPVSVNVIQTAQVVVLDKEQILSIAADINAQSVETKVADDGVDSENETKFENEVEEEETATEDSTNETEAFVQHANHLTTSWSVSGASSYPHIIDTEFTFVPITLAPESSRSITRAPTPTPKPTATPSAVKKVKSGSNSLTTSAYTIFAIALSICIVGQYF